MPKEEGVLNDFGHEEGGELVGAPLALELSLGLSRSPSTMEQVADITVEGLGNDRTSGDCSV